MSSRVVQPPGSGVPVAGREGRVQHVDVDREVDGVVGRRRPAGGRRMAATTPGAPRSSMSSAARRTQFWRASSA